ncbi:MAG: hypothetical protein HYZ53_03365 [Planctomycetes bacterium]|nr:hypothetical protein [Planctomycetota bacterium]
MFVGDRTEHPGARPAHGAARTRLTPVSRSLAPRFASLLFLALFAPSCAPTRLSEAARERLYPPIADVGAHALLREALARATASYGDPRLPVRRVDLRRGGRSGAAAGSFPLCELTDPAAGHFTLYLGEPPESPLFVGQLAHEAFHLLDTRFYDWYVEGLATVFAETFVRGKGLDWAVWERRFAAGGAKDPYAAGFAMMRAVVDAVGAEGVRGFLDFGVPASGSGERRRIDPDAWLHSLPEGARRAALRALRAHGKTMARAAAAVAGEGGNTWVPPSRDESAE